jgi:hypothetical protein
VICYPSHILHIRIQMRHMFCIFVFRGVECTIPFVIFGKLVSNYYMQPDRRMKATAQSPSFHLVPKACCHDQINSFAPSKRSPLESGDLSHVFLYIYVVLNISLAQHRFVGHNQYCIVWQNPFLSFMYCSEELLLSVTRNPSPVKHAPHVDLFFSLPLHQSLFSLHN